MIRTRSAGRETLDLTEQDVQFSIRFWHSEPGDDSSLQFYSALSQKQNEVAAAVAEYRGGRVEGHPGGLGETKGRSPDAACRLALSGWIGSLPGDDYRRAGGL